GSVMTRKGVAVSCSALMATIRLSCCFGHCISRRLPLLIGRPISEEKPKNEHVVLPQRWDTKMIDAARDVDKQSLTSTRVTIESGRFFRRVFDGGGGRRCRANSRGEVAAR